MSDYPDYSSDVAWFKDTIKGLQAQVDELSRGRNVPSLAGIPTGTYLYCAGRNAPAGTLKTDGASYAISSYGNLAAYLRPKIGTVTVSVASPGVFTCAGHALVPGDRVYLTTSGALPTGLATYTVYYVIASGLTSTTFQLSTAAGGAAIVTSGTQSGTHSLYFSPYEAGAVSSVNFKVPDNGDYVMSGQKLGSAQFGSIGAVYGEKTHLQTEAEMPSHTHIQNSHTHGFGANQSGASVHATGGGGYNVGFNNQGFGEMMFYRYPDYTQATNQNTGGNTPFNVIQLTRTALIVIKT